MTDSNDEYKRGYRDGYRDGQADANKVIPVPTIPPYPQMPATPPYPYQPDNPNRLNISSRCPVCGVDWSGPMGYVCPRNDCPTKVWCINDAGNGFYPRIN